MSTDQSLHPTYRIQLPQFEGPFDLLLFFIERDELDIHDIPIATITNDFLDYIRQMQEMNIELASEFIYVAATLMRIKAKLLLPRPELDEHGEEVDPREELVQRLLEYKRYKEVMGDLTEMEQAASERAKRGFAKGEEKLFLKQGGLPEEELVGLSLFTLMRAFKRIMERHQDELRKPAHVIRRYPYDIEEVKETLISRVIKEERVDFVSIVMEHPDRIYVVFCFLSILELVQTQHIDITVGEGFNNFWLEKKDPPTEENLEDAENQTEPAAEP